MKILILSVASVLALHVASAGEANAKISDVHLCCKGCVTAAQKAVGKIAGATAEVDQDGGTVTLKGPDKATVQKAADALVAAGYFGKSSDPDIKIDSSTGAKGEKVQKLRVEGVHLCCGSCVKAVDRAVKSVPGVKEQNAAKNATSFEVTGDFNDQEVFTALQKEGLTGKAGK